MLSVLPNFKKTQPNIGIYFSSRFKCVKTTKAKLIQIATMANLDTLKAKFVSSAELLHFRDYFQRTDQNL